MKITKRTSWIGSVTKNPDKSFTVCLGESNKKLTFKNIEVFRKFCLNIDDAFQDTHFLNIGKEDFKK